MDDVEKATKDSLKRQIAEVKKQIASFSAKSNRKDLELRRIHDQYKSSLIISYLKLKKDLKDLQFALEEHKKQWNLDYCQQEHIILVLITQHCTSQELKWKYSRLSIYEEIQDILKSAIPNYFQLFEGWYDEEETTARVLIDSRLENFEQSHENLQVLAKLETIRREISQFSLNVNKPEGQRKALNSVSNFSNISKNSNNIENFSKSYQESSFKSLASSSDNLISLNSAECEIIEKSQDSFEKKAKKTGCCRRLFKCFIRKN